MTEKLFEVLSKRFPGEFSLVDSCDQFGEYFFKAISHKSRGRILYSESDYGYSLLDDAFWLASKLGLFLPTRTQLVLGQSPKGRWFVTDRAGYLSDVEHESDKPEDAIIVAIINLGAK